MEGTLEERFWAKVDKRGPDDCWEWQAWRNNKGYGQMSKGTRDSGLIYAHHVSWELANGPIPTGLCVLHHCDNPACVNPRHLFLGTKADNTHDMMKKGRNARGQTNGQSKLTERDVHEIRQMLGWRIFERVIAKKYGVGRTAINAVKTGKNWSWLKEA